ncbi:tRNA threonylcarbamoyladenosine dehydratase [Campylobacter canadensis]|uniref:ThiF family adenylyltransferase n=1 Tax=Campylobacter canadensis TaxID=449520 RepID=A0ABS7WTY0_9BACT|nr:ThiF family adenylyltransferase [Campylobacter canadensis]MBZ7987988.1 ThiF family adenylyltransferase [Campylobacter canadensis]MBZ7995426.1 ThiF family adenylyltransferase [Campylobacter canadensis]MBZ7996986.1 ThiF family adenylyltransferase [Campylobacter canadensis]MBZ7998942.1 ThiF family adenylyltransferase [Campylobacter canadensis]MBZ8000750.1 ThiF family adenylyltransferase [Campylobacter canadensis]
MQDERFNRAKLLFADKYEKLCEKKILVCGLGGVGGACFSSLARVGIKVYGIDCDSFEASNQNRQLHSENIGRKKAEVFSEFYKLPCFDFCINKESLKDFLEKYHFDYVIDCIDDLYAKCDIAELCYEKNIKLISSAGAAKRIDVSKIKLSNWDKTRVCALAKAFRLELKKRRFKGKFKVLFSEEEAMCKELGSFMGVTSTFGNTLSSIVLKELLKES